MIRINHELKASDLKNKLTKFWELSAKKIKLIEKDYDESKGSPVFTIDGKYSTRGWTNGRRDFNTDLLFSSMMQQEKNLS